MLFFLASRDRLFLLVEAKSAKSALSSPSLLLTHAMGLNLDQWKLAGQILENTFLYNKEIVNQGSPFFLVSVAVPTCDAQNCCSHLVFRKGDITSALRTAEQLYPCYVTEHLHASGTFCPVLFSYIIQDMTLHVPVFWPLTITCPDVHAGADEELF